MTAYPHPDDQSARGPLPAHGGADQARTPKECASGAILDRALGYLTAGLDASSAAQLRSAARSPDWAARCGYALGYLDGGEDHRKSTADDWLALEDFIAGLRTRLAELAPAAAGGRANSIPREPGGPR